MRLFTEHPESVGETYGQHLVHAQSFGWRMTLAGLACVIHSVLPFLFANTARCTVGKLYMQLITNRGDVKNGCADSGMASAEAATIMHI